MLRNLFILALLIPVSLLAQTLTVASYNIRYQNADDNKKGNAWRDRCQPLCDQIRWEHPDIFGAQEVLHPQLLDIESALPEYKWIGVGRDDGHQAGEYAAIFYDPARLQLIRDGHFWLNETPERPALGWDAACIRICTWGHFRDITSNREFYFLNLHMDHVGHRARAESARLVISRINELTGNGNTPAILTGDFNVPQTDSLYSIFTSALKDCYTVARHRFAENGTWNSYRIGTYTTERIDHIFVTPSVQVKNYAVLTDTRWQREANDTVTHRLLSDHYPVFARITIN